MAWSRAAPPGVACTFTKKAFNAQKAGAAAVRPIMARHAMLRYVSLRMARSCSLHPQASRPRSHPLRPRRSQIVVASNLNSLTTMDGTDDEASHM